MSKRAGWAVFFMRLRAGEMLHGVVLIDAQCAHAAGRWFTGPSDADDALNEAEREGLVERIAYAPTTSQLALSQEKKLDDRTRRFYASRWTWRVRVLPTDREDGFDDA